jgi:hypothetical protein
MKARKWRRKRRGVSLSVWLSACGESVSASHQPAENIAESSFLCHQPLATVSETGEKQWRIIRYLVINERENCRQSASKKRQCLGSYRREETSAKARRRRSGISENTSAPSKTRKRRRKRDAKAAIGCGSAAQQQKERQPRSSGSERKAKENMAHGSAEKKYQCQSGKSFLAKAAAAAAWRWRVNNHREAIRHEISFWPAASARKRKLCNESKQPAESLC